MKSTDELIDGRMATLRSTVTTGIGGGAIASGVVNDNLVFGLNIKNSSPLIIPSSSDWNIDNGEYSIDGFFFINNLAGSSNSYSEIFWIGQANYGSVYLNLAKLRSGLGNQLYLDYQSTTQRSVIETGTFFTPSTYFVRAAAYTPVNKWTYFGVSVSFTNSQMKYYQNGVLAGIVPIAGNWNYADTLHVGRYNYGSGSPIDGRLPIIRFYKGKCLTDAEFLQNFNANKADYGL
jgi:hypothetical protein